MRKLQASILSLATIGGIVALIVWQFLPQPHIAQQHPLRYYLSLPVNWSPDRTWPILAIIDGVNQGHFLWNFLRFQQARHRLPFIAGANYAGRGVVTSQKLPNVRSSIFVVFKAIATRISPR